MPESASPGPLSIRTEIGQSAIPPGWKTGRIDFPGVFAALDAPATLYHPFGMKSGANTISYGQTRELRIILPRKWFTALPSGARVLGAIRTQGSQSLTLGYPRSSLRGCNAKTCADTNGSSMMRSSPIIFFSLPESRSRTVETCRPRFLLPEECTPRKCCHSRPPAQSNDRD